MKLQIGPLEVPVVYGDLTKEETWGEFQCLPHPQITVNKDLPNDIKALTILHEVLECITEIFGLRLTEGDIRTLEMSLATIIKKNPQEFGKWVEDLTSSGDSGCGSESRDGSGIFTERSIGESGKSGIGLGDNRELL